MQQRMIQGDCLEVLNSIPDNSIEIILVDLPYGTTGNKWDSIIPMEDYIIHNSKPITEEDLYTLNYKKGIPFKETVKYFKENRKRGLWFHYERVLKKGGVILLFSQQPFTSYLVKHKWFRYEWIWEKTAASGHLNAKKMPMKAHENVLVFYPKLPTYSPQKTKGHERKVSKGSSRNKSIERRQEKYGENYTYGKETEVADYDSTERYPRDVIRFSSDKQKSAIHPTQKPVDLIKYFIKTYSKKGEKITVLDNASGSGTTAVASSELGVESICIEKDYDIYQESINRLKELGIKYAQN